MRFVNNRTEATPYPTMIAAIMAMEKIAISHNLDIYEKAEVAQRDGKWYPMFIDRHRWINFVAEG